MPAQQSKNAGEEEQTEDPPKCHFIHHGSDIKKSGIELEDR
jgi:hypothetical protein